MDKYNCGACTKRYDCDVLGERCADDVPYEVSYEIRYDTEPQHMHPCEHGTPIVASAIAGVEFKNADYGWRKQVLAKHAHDDADYEWYTNGSGTWQSMYGWESRFCHVCGLLLPTADQLAAMYDQQREGRG